MSIQGDGTKNSPYIVNSWGTMVEALTIKGNSISDDLYIEFDKSDEKKYIDMNIEIGSWITDRISIPTSDGTNKNIINIYIEGNNWIINGASFFGTSCFFASVSGTTGVAVNISNLNFLNFYLLNTTGGGSYGCSLFDCNSQLNTINYCFTKCCFSGVLDGYGSKAGLIKTGKSKFDNCSLSLYLKHASCIILSSSTSADVIWNNTNVYIGGSSTAQLTGSVQGLTCHIIGHLKSFDAPNLFNFANSSAYNVIDLTIDSTTQSSILIGNNHSLVNKDKILSENTSTTIKYADADLAVTQEEFYSEEYLHSIDWLLAQNIEDEG